MSQQHHPRRTKIVGTIGPASSDATTIEALIRAGLDVARLNFSHGTHEDHSRIYAQIRSAEVAAGRAVSVMQDLRGPKIRVGIVDGQAELELGREVILSSANDFEGTSERLPTSYTSLGRDVREGEDILLADGRVQLEVISTDGHEVKCRITEGGVVSSNKGINLPGTRISMPSVTEKDLADLEFGLSLGVDYVALSFVRSPRDVQDLKNHMKRLGREVPTIAKIEKPEAVKRLGAIIDISDGIMVARGDLGVELPPEQVPPIQRRAIRMARARGKLTVVATQMLMSMTENPHPTHAEVSDVANAVFDGTDAVMLSEETAAGHYPVRAVETMGALAHAAEETGDTLHSPEFAHELTDAHAWAIAKAAVVTAAETDAEAIVSFTQHGLGPRMMATLRPRCRILGCAATEEGTRRMAFYWGVTPLKIASPTSVESLVSAVEHAAVDRGILGRGSTVVITSKMPFTVGQHTNMLKLHTIS